jgi:TonB family protein
MAYSYKSTPRDRDRDGMDYELFRMLEFKGSRKHSLSMSIVVHGVLLSALLLIPLLFTDSIKVHFNTTLLAPPPPKPKQILEVTHYKLPTPPPPKPAPPKPLPQPEKPLVSPPPKPIVIKPPEVKPPEPKLAEVRPPEPVPEKPKPTVRNVPEFDKAATAAAATPKPDVKTGAFSTGSSATPTTNLPAAKVQTGGFGDPNGIKGEGKPGKAGNIASLGSFDLPVGPGAGNGTGGANGTKGVVASTGFGNGTAITGNDGNGAGGGKPGRSVSQGGFGDNTEAAKPEAPKKRETGPPTTPVEITFKPKPDYTDEARKLKLEGEVLVRVLFTSAGEVRVLDVVRGLGHGLDETALRAAKQIKFKPAQREGQPVDSTATVHIVFQLAY